MTATPGRPTPSGCGSWPPTPASRRSAPARHSSHNAMKAGVRPAAERDVSAIKAVGSTGSPLSPEGFDWIYEQLGADTWLFSTSGGTDLCTAFVGGMPLLPVHARELQARALGADIHAFDEQGQAAWSTRSGSWSSPSRCPRCRSSSGAMRTGRATASPTFEAYPGVWHHGDWIRITPRGSAVIYGRSDATINRGGIRMGTAEIYRAVLAVPDVRDALDRRRPTPRGHRRLLDAAVRGPGRRRPARRDRSPRSGAASARIAHRATSPTRSSPSPRSPARCQARPSRSPQADPQGADPAQAASRDCSRTPPRSTGSRTSPLSASPNASARRQRRAACRPR